MRSCASAWETAVKAKGRETRSRHTWNEAAGMAFRAKFALVLPVALCAAGLACTPGGRDGEPLPQLLRIGVTPDESEGQLSARYTPLLDYLSATLGVSCKLVFPESYRDLVDLFTAGDVDLAHFGGVTFVTAWGEGDIIPIVMRENDLAFTSYFIVRADHPAQTLHDLKGESLAFVSELSTSGYYMPRFFMGKQGIVPETFFDSISFTGAHDTTAYRVRDGQAAVGVANSTIIDGMYADGRLLRDDVRVLWETPLYVDHVWALRPEYAGTAATALRDAFLALLASDEEHARILRALDAAYYLPASLDDFDALKASVEEHPVGMENP